MGYSAQIEGWPWTETDSSFKETREKTDYIFHKWPQQYSQAHTLFQNFATDNR